MESTIFDSTIIDSTIIKTPAVKVFGMVINSNWRNVGLLACSQALAFCVSSALVFVGSLIGHDLAPTPSLATLPIAAMVVGTASFTYPITILMQRFGRRNVIRVALVFAALDALIIAYSLEIQSFWLYCGAVVGTGASMAALAQFRFWAMESVGSSKMTTAASIVLMGGIVAAFLGPELALLGESLLDTMYQGTFILIALVLLMVVFIVTLIDEIPFQRNSSEWLRKPYRQLLQSPWLWTAIIASMIGYSIMTLIMTATPISMHYMHGHELEDTKWVIQSHVAAMFLPSLFMPFISRFINQQGMIVIGVVIYLICISIALVDVTLIGFWSSLVLLGFGWNLLFVAGTSLLPLTHCPEDRFRVQAFNDGFVFSFQAIASLSSGFLLNLLGWQALLLTCLPLCALPISMLLFSRRFSVMPTAAIS